MKKINKKNVWHYKKIKVNETDVYKFWNEDKSECYFSFTFSQILDCLEEPTKEAREKYIINLKKG